MDSESDGGQGDAEYSKLVVKSAEEEETPGSIELDAQSLDGKGAAKMREIYVVKNAKLAKADALMTEPVEVE